MGNRLGRFLLEPLDVAIFAALLTDARLAVPVPDHLVDAKGYFLAKFKFRSHNAILYQKSNSKSIAKF
jgi:hypothetical protein